MTGRAPMFQARMLRRLLGAMVVAVVLVGGAIALNVRRPPPIVRPIAPDASTALSNLPMLAAGRLAIEDRGCAGCHEIPGAAVPNLAPDLDGLRDKVDPAWVRAWLLDSDKLDPAHRMPRFDLRGGEVEALTAFLFSLPGPGVSEIPGTFRGDAERGRVAVATRRCATCHSVEGRGGLFGPRLDAVGAKIKRAWLFAYLTDTHRLRPRTRMPGFRLPSAEAADIVAFAEEQWVPDTPEPPWAGHRGEVRRELADEGRKLFVSLGCRGCHIVTGIEFQRIAVPLVVLAQRPVSDLPPARSGERMRDIPAWVARKVISPRAFDLAQAAPSRMPTFSVGDSEAMAIGMAVGALRAGPPEESVRAVATSKIPEGEVGQLIERFRCLVCHRVGGQGGNISRVHLDGEGSRVRRPWLETFLQHPVTLRMDQSERMPVLGIDAPSAALLANWIDSTLRDSRIAEEVPPTEEETTRGERLFRERGCPGCHVARGQGKMYGPVLDGARDRLQFGYAVALLQQGTAVLPEPGHHRQTFPREESRAMAAYACSLASIPRPNRSAPAAPHAPF